MAMLCKHVNETNFVLPYRFMLLLTKKSCLSTLQRNSQMWLCQKVSISVF